MKKGLGSNIKESIGAGGGKPANPAAPPTPKAPSLKSEGVERSRNVSQIPLGSIMADAGQPRKEFDQVELQQLAASLKSMGQLQPIQVWWSAPDQRYIIAVGERRWRAAKIAGLTTIQAVIRESRPDEKELRAIQLMENCIRQDLQPIERSEAMRDLMLVHGYGQAELAKQLGFSQGLISQAVAILDLPEEVKAKVSAGKITAKAAYELTKLETAEEQREVAGQIESDKLSTADVGKVVKKRVAASKAAAPATPTTPGNAPKPKPKVANKPTERIFNHAGIKLVASRGRGFDKTELREALESALTQVNRELSEVA
jgi:ParB family chromosome partitioning protein